MQARNNIVTWIGLGNTLLARVGAYIQPIFLLIFRLHWGYEFFLSGRGKLMDHPKVVAFFTELGIPAPELNAWFVGGVECFGGLLLLMGLASRPVALMLAGNMLVAYLSVTEDRAAFLNVLSDPEPFIAADPFFFLLTATLVFAFGPGVISFDTLIDKWFNRGTIKK